MAPCCAACGLDAGAQALVLVDHVAASRAACANMGALTDGWLPTVVWPSDVDAYKRKLEPDFDATDAAVSRCTNLSAGDVAAWSDFWKAWKLFDAEPTPLFGSANKYDEAKSYEDRLSAWQKRLAGTCALSSPLVTPNTGPDATALKWLAGAVIAGAIAYTIHAVLR